MAGKFIVNFCVRVPEFNRVPVIRGEGDYNTTDTRGKGRVKYCRYKGEGDLISRPFRVAQKLSQDDAANQVVCVFSVS